LNPINKPPAVVLAIFRKSLLLALVSVLMVIGF
jgi:hypothetical protein